MTTIPGLDLHNWKPDDFLKAIALAGAVLAFLVGLCQYVKAQKWKRAEWVAQEMKTLLGAPAVQSALFLIDWQGGRVDKLFAGYSRKPNEPEVIGNTDVNNALVPHVDRPEGFNDIEAEIRTAFDQFFDGMERFASYRGTGLLKTSDLRPHLDYWAGKICEPAAKHGDRAYHLRVYMRTYGFTSALDLLERLSRPPRWLRLSI